MINIRRPITDHHSGRLCRCVLRLRPGKDERKCKHHGFRVKSVCQICNGHSCANPDCDSSIDVGEEHFGLRCATCWKGPPDPPLFYKLIHACQHIERTDLERYGPDYKEGDPEVVDGRYDAGEHRYRNTKHYEYFCESSGEAWQRTGQTVWGPHSKREAKWHWDVVRYRSGHTPITWDVCEDCQQPVYKSIRRYRDRLYKEYELRKKEYYLQRGALRTGAETLRDIKRYLRNRTPASR